MLGTEEYQGMLHINKKLELLHIFLIGISMTDIRSLVEIQLPELQRAELLPNKNCFIKLLGETKREKQKQEVNFPKHSLLFYFC